MILKIISILFSVVMAQDAELSASSPTLSYFKNDFPGAIAEAKKNKRPWVLIEFGAKWCPACLKFEHDVLNSDEFKSKYNQFTHLLIDYDWEGSKEYRDRYHVKDMPTMLVVNLKGDELERVHGYTTVKNFTDKLDAFLKSDKATVLSLEKKGLKGDKVAADRSGLVAYNSLDYEKAIKLWAKTEQYKEELQLAKINLENGKKPINKPALVMELDKYIKTYPDSLDTPFVMFHRVKYFDVKKDKDSIISFIKDLQKKIDKMVAEKTLPNDGKTKDSSRDEQIIEKSGLYAVRARVQKYLAAVDPIEKNHYTTVELRNWGDAVDEARKEIRSSKDYGRRITVASYLGEAGRADEADRELWNLQKENPKEYHYPYRRAMIAFKNKNYKLAEAQAREAVPLSRGEHRIYTAALLAEILESIGKKDEARTVAKEGLARAPETLEKDSGASAKVEYLKKVVGQ